MPLAEIPEELTIWVLDGFFPDTFISREGETLVCQIEVHSRTKSRRAVNKTCEVLNGSPFELPQEFCAGKGCLFGIAHDIGDN